MSVSGIGRCQWVKAIFYGFIKCFGRDIFPMWFKAKRGIFNARFPKVFFLCISKSIVFLSLKIDLVIAKKKRKLMKESILRHYI